MTNVEHPHGLSRLIDLTEHPVDDSVLPEEETADFAFCSFGFAGEGTAVWKLFERIQTVDEFLKPLRPPEKGARSITQS